MGICKSKLRPKEQKLSVIRRFSKLNIHQFYRFTQILGSGSFGTVKLAFSLEQERNGLQSKCYAVKSIDKHRIGQRLHLIQRELEILVQLDHPNIIRVYETYEDMRYYHFVMEYCRGGELFERIVRKGVFSERKCSILMKQLFSAVHYMHQQGVTHRDLKPENLMLVSPDDDFDIRIIDFGLSKKYPPPQSTNQGRSQVRTQTKVGTPIYVAPEVLLGKYSQTCDEWSLGCIMYVLLCGEPPFFSNNLKVLEEKIQTKDIQFKENSWQQISNEAKMLVIRLLDKNPKKRITCAQALSSPWILKYGSAPPSRMESIPNNEQENEKAIQLLRTYGNISKLKKETLNILLNQLNETQIQSLRQQFEEFDKDHSGTISVKEMTQIMKKLGFNDTEKEIQELIKKLKLSNKNDVSSYGDLNIQYSEFMMALLNQQQYLNEERLWGLFKQFDIDNKNYITSLDVRRAFERRGKQLSTIKVDTMFNEISLKSQDKIDFQRFHDLMLADSLKTQDDENHIPNMSKMSTTNNPQNLPYLNQPIGDFNFDI
ncbi:unnamed protein product [Paramecium primaurelia]|uniref:Calcium-dependent protein kinase n=1 Tax=Paramecium primaurelia TaxID=5886 RepID=A0A8S1K3Q5_PARPR|nr:unnamed protein product [Paramecium primaurelia]